MLFIYFEFSKKLNERLVVVASVARVVHLLRECGLEVGPEQTPGRELAEQLVTLGRSRQKSIFMVHGDFPATRHLLAASGASLCLLGHMFEPRWQPSAVRVNLS